MFQLGLTEVFSARVMVFDATFNFQYYFSYLMAVRLIGGAMSTHEKTTDLPQVTVII